MIASLLSLVLSGLIFLQAIALRRSQGTWLTPGVIFALYWALMTAIPIVLIGNAAPIAGTFAILVMVTMFSLGTFLVPSLEIAPEPQRRGLYDMPFLKLALLFTTVAALGCLAYNSTLQGISLDRALTLEAAAEYTENRYSGDLVSNVFIQLATVLAYVGAALAGLLIGNAGRSRPLIIILGLAPTLFVLVTQSAKGALLLCGALIAAGHIIRAIDARSSRLISRAAARRILFYIALVFPLLIVSFLARGLYGAVSAPELTFQLYRYLLSYTSGHLVAFNDWMQHYWGFGSTIFYPDPGTPPGFFTFMSVARLLGNDTPIPPGTYDEYFSLSDLLQTNVYTMFRGLIVDFSFVGAMVFMLFSGALAKMVYRALMQRAYSPFSISCFVIFVAATQQSPYISLFQYNSSYAFGAVLFVILAINHYGWVRRQSQHGREIEAARKHQDLTGRKFARP